MPAPPFADAPVPPPVQTPFRAPRSPVKTALLILGAAMLLALVWEAPRELERWRLAGAVSARASGDKAGADAKINQLVERDPKNTSLRLLRADWRLADGDSAGAAADMDAAVEAQPSDLALRIKRAQAYQKTGRYADAVDDWEEVKRRTQGAGTDLRIMVLNGTAYARALGDIEVEQGLKEIQEVFKLLEASAQSQRAAELDTRGFLHYRAGDYDAALEDLDAAVAGVETMLAAANKVQARPGTSSVDVERGRKNLRENVAVIHYHRGLVLEKLERTADAEKDFARVRELGFEPGEKLQ